MTYGLRWGSPAASNRAPVNPLPGQPPSSFGHKKPRLGGVLVFVDQTVLMDTFRGFSASGITDFARMISIPFLK